MSRDCVLSARGWDIFTVISILPTRERGGGRGGGAGHSTQQAE